jgi:hypothetical protein
MEIERYTLATGETALTGFNRFWKHWGLVLALMVYFANLWPGWALSSATLGSYLFGGDPRTIAVVMLVVIGASLTLAPVVYVALERLIFVKVGAVATLAILAALLVITSDSWRMLPGGLVNVGFSAIQLCSLFGAGVRRPEAARTSVRATGSATKASGWASTCLVWSARSPVSRKRFIRG